MIDIDYCVPHMQGLVSGTIVHQSFPPCFSTIDIHTSLSVYNAVKCSDLFVKLTQIHDHTMRALRQSPVICSYHKKHAYRMEVLLGMHGETITSPNQESAISKQIECVNAIQENLDVNDELSNTDSAAHLYSKLSSGFEPIFELKLPNVPTWRRRFPLERLPFDIKCQLLCSLGRLSTLRLLLIASADFYRVSKLIRTKLLNVYKDDIKASGRKYIYQRFVVWSKYVSKSRLRVALRLPSLPRPIFQGFLPYIDRVYWAGTSCFTLVFCKR